MKCYLCDAEGATLLVGVPRCAACTPEGGAYYMYVEREPEPGPYPKEETYATYARLEKGFNTTLPSIPASPPVQAEGGIFTSFCEDLPTVPSQDEFFRVWYESPIDEIQQLSKAVEEMCRKNPGWGAPGKLRQGCSFDVDISTHDEIAVVATPEDYARILACVAAHEALTAETLRRSAEMADRAAWERFWTESWRVHNTLAQRFVIDGTVVLGT